MKFPPKNVCVEPQVAMPKSIDSSSLKDIIAQDEPAWLRYYPWNSVGLCLGENTRSAEMELSRV